MVILGVDLGDSRTGIAVCDAMEMLASPVAVIPDRYIPHVLEKTAEYAASLKAQQIVVGYPKNMNASVGERAEKCASFAQDLQDLTGIPTVLWDERLTTVMAHNALDDSKTFGKKRKAIIDSVAAVMILQSYIDHRRIRNERSVQDT